MWDQHVLRPASYPSITGVLLKELAELVQENVSRCFALWKERKTWHRNNFKVWNIFDIKYYRKIVCGHFEFLSSHKTLVCKPRVNVPSPCLCCSALTSGSEPAAPPQLNTQIQSYTDGRGCRFDVVWVTVTLPSILFFSLWHPRSYARRLSLSSAVSSRVSLSSFPWTHVKRIIHLSLKAGLGSD